MLNISYTITPETKELLNTVDNYRRTILLFPIQPSSERKLVWEATLSRAHYVSQISGGTRLPKTELTHLLTNHPVIAPGDPRRIIVNYAAALGFLREEWLGNRKTVTLATIETVAELLYRNMGKMAQLAWLPVSDVKKLLEYLQAQEEHPVITAGIAYSQWVTLENTPNVSPMALLVSYLFLYKAGFDFRGLLVLEEGLIKNPREYETSLTPIATKGISNGWLSFFAQETAKELSRIRERIQGDQQGGREFTLTDRQRSIVGFLENPEAAVTNKKVQKLFKISQITASRELAKLSDLGLIAPHGKGRSVYYTKV